VSNENGSLDVEFSAKLCEVIRELRHRVFLRRCIAGAVPNQIRGYHAVIPAEVIDLWRKEVVITGPAVDEYKRGDPEPTSL
jgi:hypothetical protein